MNRDLKDIVMTPEIRDIVSRSTHYLRAGFPLHLTGPAGIGKTTLAHFVAGQLGQPITTIRGHHDISSFDLLGGAVGFTEKVVSDNFIHSVYKRESRVQETRVDGQLVTAVKEGHTLIYDEFTRSRSETNNILLAVLEEGILPLYGSKDGRNAIPVHPKFSAIFTSNPSEYAGVFKLPDALLDRMITIQMYDLSMDSESAIVAKATGLSAEDAALVVQYVSRVRSLYFRRTQYFPSVRASLKIARIVAALHIPIHHDHPDFQILCADVLGTQLTKVNGPLSPTQIRELIVTALEGV